MSEIGRHLGVVFDDADAQLIFTTVEEEVTSGLENQGLSHNEMRRRLQEVMESTGITALADRAPHTLSGGQKQRVAIAATPALGTEILILDEPTAELDTEATVAVSTVLQRLASEGTAVLVVEQKIGDLAALADRMIIIEDGSIIADGTPGQVMRNERSPLTPLTGRRRRAPPLRRCFPNHIGPWTRPPLRWGRGRRGY